MLLQTVFEYKLFPVGYQAKILVLLYSLPKPHPDFDKWNFVKQEIMTPSFLCKYQPLSCLPIDMPIATSIYELVSEW